MSYAVKEIFLTLQGEGAHAGRAAVFAVLPAATSGAAARRTAPTATCHFCDTDFVGTDGTLGGRYATAAALADTIAGAMDRRRGRPLRGADRRRAAAAGRSPPDRRARMRHGFEIGVETNGTIAGARWARLDLRQPEGRHRPRGCAAATN